MKLKYLKAKNFLSIGNEPVEIDFTKLKNIVCIKGNNLDAGESCSNGAGKCFLKGTLVMMSDGKKKAVEDVEVGDFVMGDDGTPRKVISLHSGLDMIYEVRGVNSTSYFVNSKHILVLKAKRLIEHPSRDGELYKISVEDFLNQPEEFKSRMLWVKSTPEFEEKPVPMNPYFIGLWLRKGERNGLFFKNIGYEQLNTLYSMPSIIGSHFIKRKRQQLWDITITKNATNAKFKKLNLIENKHIPDVYKFNCKEVRSEILAGLLEFSRIHEKSIVFDSSFERLRDDVSFLARSLGFYVHEYKKEVVAARGAVKEIHAVRISGELYKLPFYKPKSLGRILPETKVNVKEHGVGEYYGFQIDGNGMFLLPDFTVVHNSTIIESVVYGLYGELIKGLNHKDAINIYNKKDLEIEVHWDNYKVIRQRGTHNRLSLYKNNFDISQSGIPAVQNQIKRILKLDSDSFVNICCFGQHNVKPFLACDAKNKRKMAENLLSLDCYAGYQEAAKTKLKENKSKISSLSETYRLLISNISSLRNKRKSLFLQRESWLKLKEKEIQDLENKHQNLLKELVSLENSEDVRQYNEYKNNLDEIEIQLDKANSHSKQLYEALEKAEQTLSAKKNQLQEILIEKSKTERDISILKRQIFDWQSEIKKGENNLGTKCIYCFGDVTKDNINCLYDHYNKKINSSQELLSPLILQFESLSFKVSEIQENIEKVSQMRLAAKEKQVSLYEKVSDLSNKKRNISNVLKQINYQEQINLFKKNIENLEERIVREKVNLTNGDPYKVVIEQMDSEIAEEEMKSNSSRRELEQAEKMHPYYDYWVKAFGDDGIRSLVISEVIPMLNNRINYWLQFLMDSRIKVTFEKDLEETITRNPEDKNPFVYNSLSGGEHSRVDLAISQAFAHIMMLTSGTCPSFVALDEVGTNLDRPGILSLYNMIQELSRDRQVFVITHDPDLLDLLSKEDEIEVVMKNGFTTLSDK